MNLLLHDDQPKTVIFNLRWSIRPSPHRSLEPWVCEKRHDVTPSFIASKDQQERTKDPSYTMVPRSKDDDHEKINRVR